MRLFPEPFSFVLLTSFHFCHGVQPILSCITACLPGINSYNTLFILYKEEKKSLSESYQAQLSRVKEEWSGAVERTREMYAGMLDRVREEHSSALQRLTYLKDMELKAAMAATGHAK